MRKFGFMLMMLVVMGIAASCEKSEIVNQDFNSGKSESTENLINAVFSGVVNVLLLVTADKNC